MQDNRTFEFWWTPSYEYYVDANKAFRRLHRVLRSEITNVAAGLVLLAVGASDRNSLAVFLGVTFSVGVALWQWVLRPYRTKRFWTQNPSYANAVHGTVRASEGLTLVEQDAVHTFRWAAISRVEETERQFLLFLDGRNLQSFLQIPKSAVLDEGSVEDLRAVLRERFGATAVS